MSKDLAERSSLSHLACASASLSATILLSERIGRVISPSTGQEALPSKWPQKPLASTTSRKQTEKMTQLLSEASSLGTLEGSELDKEVEAMVDIIA